MHQLVKVTHVDGRKSMVDICHLSVALVLGKMMAALTIDLCGGVTVGHETRGSAGALPLIPKLEMSF